MTNMKHFSGLIRGLALAVLMAGFGAAHAADVVTYYHTDALGTPVMESDAAAVVAYVRESKPYGEQAVGAPKNGPGFTGHLHDVETGLTYMQARYFDSQVGRFISNDPVPASPDSGQNYNRYWYANNNPYRYTDPDGMKPQDDDKTRKERKDERDREKNSDIVIVRKIGTATSRGSDTKDIAKASAKLIRAYLRSHDYEACSNFCPVYENDVVVGYTAEVVTNESYGWCRATPCSGGTIAGYNHAHPKDSYIGREYDALYNRSVKVGKVNFSNSREFSKGDQGIFNPFLTTMQSLFNWVGGKREEVK